MRLRSFAAVLLFGLATASPAFAQPDQMSVEAARRLGQEGIALYQNGDYPSAVQKLEWAYRVMNVPTLGLWSARALEKTGDWVTAAERYREVTRTSVKPGDPEVFRSAQAEAAGELAALEPRIPKLTIDVKGADSSGVTLKIDGAPKSNALIGVPVSVNPGTRKVEGSVGDQVVMKEALLTEGQSAVAVLEFTTVDATAPTPLVGASAPPAAAAESDQGTSDAGSTQRTLAWAALGLGGAGLVVGTVTGVVALSKQSDLEANCAGGKCEPQFHDDVDSFGTMRTVSIVGLAVGAVGVGGGLALLFTAPTAENAAVVPWVGVASAGVRGRF